MRVGADLERCPRCREVKPRTEEHFYFTRGGLLTGYCRPCHSAYWLERYGGGLVVRRPHYARDWRRARLGTAPDRYRQGAPA